VLRFNVVGHHYMLPALRAPIASANPLQSLTIPQTTAGPSPVPLRPITFLM
jgi:hypothetical protein